jgi:peroxiredoxin
MNRIFTYLLLPVFAATAVLGFTSIGIANDQVAVGDVAPEFELADQHGQLHSLEDYRDQWVVLYFYPKDDTPGCTTEACEFRDNIFAFKDLNAQILGVSLDDVESHKAFAENYGREDPRVRADGREAADFHHRTRRNDCEALREGEPERALEGSAGGPAGAQCSALIASSSPAIVSGYMRSSISSRTSFVDGV